MKYIQNKLVTVPEGKEILPPKDENQDPGVNSDEDENIEDIFQVSIH